MKTRGLRHDGSFEKSHGQYIASFLQCVDASHDQWQLIIHIRKYNIHDPFLKWFQCPWQCNSQAVMPVRAGILQNWTYHWSIEAQQVISSGASMFQLHHGHTLMHYLLLPKVMRKKHYARIWFQKLQVQDSVSKTVPLLLLLTLPLPLPLLRTCNQHINKQLNIKTICNAHIVNG